MDVAELRAALERRRDLYRQKRDERDGAADDTLNVWEKFDFAVEVVEWVADDLGVQLEDVDGRE